MSRLVRSDSRESVFSVSSCVSGVGGWQVGDRARVDNRSGTVSFMGPTKFAPGEWIGLTLDEPMGKNDGSVSGHRYFTCTANHGLFIKSSKLERIVMSPARFFKSPTPGEASSKHAAEFGFDIGDRVMIGGGKIGYLRFLGETSFSAGIWAGIELDQPNGKNDGSVMGKRYFTCKHPHGIFAKAGTAEKAPTQGTSQVSVHHNKASILRTEMGKRTGSFESLNSIGSPSVASSRFGVRRGPMRPPVTSNLAENSTIKALQDALSEKEKHIEQLMAERDLAENAQMTSGHGQEGLAQKYEEKFKAADNKVKELRSELAAKQKEVEDLQFRLEEEGITKQCEIDDLQQAMATMSKATAPDTAGNDDALRVEITNLTRKLSDLQTASQQEQSVAEKKVKELQDQLTDVMTNISKTAEEASAEKTRLLDEITSGKGDDAALRAEITNLTQKLSDLQTASQQEQSVAENKMKELQDQLTDALTNISKTDEEASAEKTRLQEEISAGKTQAEQEKEGLLEAQKKLQEQYDQLTASLSQQNSSESQKQAELLGEIQKTREDLKATVADLDACRDALLTQQNAVQELRSHLESVSKSAEEDAQKYAVATMASEDEASVQKEKLQKLETELTAATALLQSREQELKGELTTALASVEEQKKIISSMASEQGLSTSLQERITALETENCGQAKELKGLVEEKDGLGKKLEERVAEVQNANEERTKVEVQLKTMEEEAKVEREKATTKLQELSNHAEELKSQLESKQSAIIQLETELSSSKASWDSERSTCEALRAELFTQQTTHAQELQKLADQNKQAENKIKELEEKAVANGEQAKKEAAELRQKVEEAAAEGAQLKEKLTSALSDHEASIVALKNAHHEQVASLSSQAASLAFASKDLEDERDSLKRTVERCQEDLGKSKDKLTWLSLELTNKSEQLVAANEARNGVQVELRTAQDAFATLQSTLESSKLGENEMAKEFSAVKEESASRLAENELLRSQLTDVKTELETAKGEIQKAREETARITTREREAEDAAADSIKKLERSLAGEATARSKLENEVREKEEELKAANSRLELITAESTDSAGKLAALAADAKKKEADLEAVKSELHSTKEKFSSVSANISDMERLISALEQGSLAARQELAAKQAELDALTAALSSEQGSSAESASRLAQLTSQITELQTKIDELTASSSSAETHNKSLQEDLQKQIQELKEVSEKTSNVNAGLQKEMEEIKVEKTSVEEALKSQLTDREKELAEAVAKLEAEKSKFDAELSAANEEKSKLKKEITLNVEDLQKIKTHTEETAASSAETMSSLRNRCDTLENELKAAQQCSEEAEAKMSEVASHLKTLTEEKSAVEGQAKAALEALTEEKKALEEQLQQLNNRTTEADGAQKDMEEQVSLAQKSLADYANKIASLESRVAGEAEEKKAVEARLTSVEQEMGEKLRTAAEELATARIQLEQAKREHSEAAGAQSTQMASEFAEAMETIRVLKEEKANLAKECDAADGRLSEQHGELLRLKAVEVEATVEISKAQQKMLLFDEVEDSLKKKNLDLVEKLSEMQDQLDTLQHQTQNDQIIQLNSQIEFLNRIVATKTKEAEEMKRERDNALNPQPIDVTTTHRKREKKIRLFCDMCDTFDLHETVDCPLQAMEEAEMAAHSHHTMTTPDGKKTKKAPREYCDECEEFGHDTSLCPKNQKKKRDYTF